MPDGLITAAAAAAAVGAAWIAPGAALARAWGLGRDGLERFAVAWAVGRAMLAAGSLAAVSTVGDGGLLAVGVAGVVAFGAVRAKGPPAAAFPRDAGVPVAVAVAAALLLVVAVVARGGLPDAQGTLYFQGRDATNDPLVYVAIALGLHETGLPLSYPLAGGASTTSTYLPYGVWAGLHALGVPMRDAVMRVTPVLEASALAASAVAVVRRLGGGPLAATLGGVLPALGTGVVFGLGTLAAAAGGDATGLDPWAFFGPYLLAFNPLAPALQTAFAAWLLLSGPRSGERRVAALVGLLVASLFETKLFVWAPVLAGLGAVAWLRPPPGLAPGLRRASLWALLASLPFVFEKLLWARALAGREVTGLVACPGCLPRYLVASGLGGDASFHVFETFRAADLLDPGTLLASLGAAVAMLALGLGVRLAALPALWRSLRDAAEDPTLVLGRLAAASAAAALGAACIFTTRPHYLNGAQFATVAGVLLWPFAAIPVARGLRARPLATAALLAGLVLPGTAGTLHRLGFAARPRIGVPAASLGLAEAVRESTGPGDVVVEPSLLVDAEFPSPLTWHAGRPVYLTLLSAAQLLPEAEVYARHERIVTLFTGRDREAAAAALAATGASWVLAPSAWPLRFETEGLLHAERVHEAGILYRVLPGVSRP